MDNSKRTKCEVWTDVIGFEGKYQVSSLGRVKRLKDGNEIYISQTKRYKGVVLWKNGVPKFSLIHRLVACSFLENNENKPCVNHIDGNPSNNSVDNLEWCTYSENEHHSFDSLGKTVWNKGKKLSKEHIEKCKNKRLATLKERTNELYSEFLSTGLTVRGFEKLKGKSRGCFYHRFKLLKNE